MDDYEDLEISTPLGLTELFYKAVAETARQKAITIEQFCYDACVAAFQRFDTQHPVENVGPGQVISASFEDTGDDIWARLTLSSELHHKLSAQAGIHQRSAEFLSERVCINALQAATGETNSSSVARGPS